MNKGHVFFISGVSGSGKGTVIKSLLKENIKNLEFVKSVKTRGLRKNETDEVDYIKKTKIEFKEMIKNNEFLEYNFVHNQNYYGTRKKDIFENGIDKGKILLKEIEMLTYNKLLEKIKEKRKYFTFIFLDLPVSEIKNRMTKRGDDLGKNYENRLNSSKKEKKLSYLCDFIVDATKSRKKVLEEVKKVILENI